MSLRRCWWLSLSLWVAAWAGCQQGEMRLGSVRQLDCSGCLEALPINGWCSSCQHGLVAGLVIPSLAFHQSLDAHGHDVEIDTLQCGMCLIVAPEDEFCTRCRNGFAAGQLYFSELTWSLALGSTMAPAEIVQVVSWWWVRWVSARAAPHSGSDRCDLFRRRRPPEPHSSTAGWSRR